MSTLKRSNTEHNIAHDETAGCGLTTMVRDIALPARDWENGLFFRLCDLPVSLRQSMSNIAGSHMPEQVVRSLPVRSSSTSCNMSWWFSLTVHSVVNYCNVLERHFVEGNFTKENLDHFG